MGQQVKTLALKPDSLSLVPRVYVAKGERTDTQKFQDNRLWFPHSHYDTPTYTPVHTHTPWHPTFILGHPHIHIRAPHTHTKTK